MKRKFTDHIKVDRSRISERFRKPRQKVFVSGSSIILSESRSVDSPSMIISELTQSISWLSPIEKTMSISEERDSSTNGSKLPQNSVSSIFLSIIFEISDDQQIRNDIPLLRKISYLLDSLSEKRISSSFKENILFLLHSSFFRIK